MTEQIQRALAEVARQREIAAKATRGKQVKADIEHALAAFVEVKP